MTVHAPAERPRILAALAEHPGQTAYEVAAQLGYAKPDSMAVADVVYRMWRRGTLIHGTAFRPHIGREARIFYVAPPGTPPLAETPEQAERRRARDRQDKANQRARAAERTGRPRSDHRTVTKASLGPEGGAAACRTADLDLFFGPDGERAADHDRRVARAKAVCFSCPIRRQCLEVAEANRETFGVWGGVDFELRRTSQATGRTLLRPAGPRSIHPAGKKGSEMTVASDQASQTSTAAEQFAEVWATGGGTSEHFVSGIPAEREAIEHVYSAEVAAMRAREANREAGE